MPKDTHEKLPEYFNKIRDQTLTDKELEDLQSLIISLQVSIASGDRAVSIVGGASGATIYTGDSKYEITREAR